MNCLYLLSIICVFGIDASRSIDHSRRKNDSTDFEPMLKRDENGPTIIANLVLTQKQTRDLEDALNKVVDNFLDSQKGKLSLRTKEEKNRGLVRTLQLIGEAIYNEIKKLLEKCGLLRPSKTESSESYKLNNASLKATIYHQILRVPLDFSPIWRRLEGLMNKHLRKKECVKKGYKSSTFEIQMNYGSSTDQLKISAFLSAIATYGDSFYNCLRETKPGGFDLRRAVGNLTNFSPEVTTRKLSKRLKKSIPKNPGKSIEYNQFHAFICRAVIEDFRLNFHECLIEIKRIDTCIYAKFNSSTQIATPSVQSSTNFYRTVQNIDDACKFSGTTMNFVAGCYRKPKASSSNTFPYIIDFFMGDLKKSPILRSMAMKIGSMVMKSRQASEAMNEVAALIQIYKHGMEKKATLMKAAQQDFHKRSVFDRMSKVLAEYKQHIQDVTHKTVSHVHRVMTTVEKILVDTASTLVGYDLSANVKTLKSWTGLIDSVFMDWTRNRSEFPAKKFVHYKTNTNKFGYKSKPFRSNALVKVPNDAGFIKSPHEEQLNKLIDSMKRLGQSGPPRRSTALMSLANTFLLATMFYECISLLAGAIYREDSSSMLSSNSAETEESDRWQSTRDRRSPAPINEEYLQPPFDEDQKEPLSLINETDKPITTDGKSDSVEIPESVGTFSDINVPKKILRERNHS